MHPIPLRATHSVALSAIGLLAGFMMSMVATVLPAIGAEPGAVSGDAKPGGSDRLFGEILSATSGVEFVHRLVPHHLNAYLYLSGYACGGVCAGDVDGDSRPDLFFVSGPDENGLFLNRGDFRFERADAGTGDGASWGAGASMADVDADGDLDLHVCNYDSANRLFLNDGKARFTEAAFACGLAFTGPSLGSYWADFDCDGDLDLFLLTNRLYSPTGYPRERAWYRDAAGRPHVTDKWAPFLSVVVPPFPTDSPDPFLQEYGHADRLFRNDGTGPDGRPHFKDVTEGSGIESAYGHGLSALLWDINLDGRPDIYVANDFIDPDRLWLNLGPDSDGRMRFRDATGELLPYTSWFSMGSDVCDLNNDGRLDFFVADMAATTHFKAKSTMGEMTGMRRWVMENGWPRQLMRNCLFIDSGAGRFLESAFLSGVARSDWTWSVRLADFDLDGRADVFLTNGIARAFSDSDVVVTDAMRVGRTEWDLYKELPEMREENLAFRNEGALHFTAAGSRWGLAKNGMSYGAATGDFDGDGDLDLTVCNLTENVSLYRNNAARRGGHWLRVRLEGAGKNPGAFGAQVTMRTADGDSQSRLMQPQTGFLSGNEPVIHFGLGRNGRAESLEVRWPDGAIQRLGPQDADQLMTLRRADAMAKDDRRNPEPAPRMFAEVAKKIGLDFRHAEKPFDDYAREFLLPGKLSQLGPGIAVADVNDDGREDVFVGGGAGQSPALFIQGADQRFVRSKNPPWESATASEAMGVHFFDADRDGDLDVYVVTGSNEWPAGDSAYLDRLYLNQSSPGGDVRFAEAPAGGLPDLRHSGSCVVGADFDRDGDVDLFVGSRSVPGAYPTPPDSVLLRNDGAEGEAKLSDATESAAPELRRSGLVTSALWSDVDGDSWPDLFVTVEWGPVRLFLNQTGRLVEATEAAGLRERTGWWNSITGGDFDGDGDIDYAAFNVGLNTKYGHPTAGKPQVLYRGDMDRLGGADLIEAKCSSEGELPVRGRSCSGNAMPFIKEKFATFKSFASANLAAIYTPNALAQAERFEATCFESGVLVNEAAPGRPRLVWKPLPPAAQISPAFGCSIADFAGDSSPCVAVAQNLFTREPETGLWRGGLGVILRGGNNSDFVEVAPHSSGFVVPGDAKGLALADLNGDARPDLLVTQNDDHLLAFENSSRTSSHRPLSIRLAGPPGNPLAIGSRVTVTSGGRRLGTAEIHGGTGYLTQSSARMFLSAPAAAAHVDVAVIWPDGVTSHHKVATAAPLVTIRVSDRPNSGADQ